MFQLILHELLATTPGAVAALFLDWEGETVDLACDRDLSDHDLRIIGAYQGIFLARLRAVCDGAGAGTLHRLKIEFERHTFLSADLRDGYYLVLVIDRDGSEALSWRRMDRCREKLLREM